MNMNDLLDDSYQNRLKDKLRRSNWHSLHLDPVLLICIAFLIGFGILILYSASNESAGTIEKQMIRLGIGFVIMFVFAQIPPQKYYQWTPWVFALGLILLVAVLFLGQVQQGGRRWFDLKLFYFQPSEIMKLAMPMMLAWVLSDRSLPPKFFWVLLCGIILIIPVLLTAKQPDLGTAIMIAMAGFSVLVLAGMYWRLILGFIIMVAAATPFLWKHMHDYQRKRILMLLNPESDHLGSGYHIIQSKIAIGSGGLYGKGWLHGSQSHLAFLPAHTTDFIFAVNAEELGLLGCVLLLIILLAVFGRSMYMSTQAQNTYGRLLAGSLSLTFILCALVNVGMVIGILPVVGIPLPLVSYGGVRYSLSWLGLESLCPFILTANFGLVNMMMITRFLLICLLGYCNITLSATATPEPLSVEAFIDKMVVVHHYDRNKLIDLFEHTEYMPEVIERISKPFEEKPWDFYKGFFITTDRIQGGINYWHEHADTISKAAKDYGVSPAVIVAIIGIETRYGLETGKYPALRTLANLILSLSKTCAFFSKSVGTLFTLN